jgi:hypothetical protein
MSTPMVMSTQLHKPNANELSTDFPYCKAIRMLSYLMHVS